MRNKHILINLTEEQFNCVKYLAMKNNRKISDYVYLLLINYINDEILKAVDVNHVQFKKLKYEED